MTYSTTNSSQPPNLGIKDHRIAQRVNEARDIALQFSESQQLRERMSIFVHSLLLEQAQALADTHEHS